MKKLFLFLAGLFIGIIIFMPKDNLYYTAQKYLAKKNIYINSNIKNSLTLKLTNGNIYQNGIDFAFFKKIEISPFVFYNVIHGENINIYIQNLKIYNLNIIYSILSPIKIYIKGNANFGKIKGEINLVKKFLKIYILDLTNENMKNFLRKDKKGYFYYAKF